ncbi:hypothetical protein Q4Q34_06560 [Flavivirga abyssicola]|uniref:hypothetical protein n=1 Tax=Flavivirga abyssicola TaxID=3063533 RepID=UPI0026E07764|nr:hypothetical protein [Flavivirga sp. MEBiC07777]WVK14689.1 hypothetical protein Q4Q34_06560 [Flavivirga sp. MEBiC07777]
MRQFKRTKNKKNSLKWLAYILIGLGLLIFIIKYSDWHFISKFLISITLIINLLFDISYFRKSRYLILQLNFNNSEIEIIDNKKGITHVSYSNLKYSIRKRKFDKDKTEIELKIKKNLKFKTVSRIHIKNWDDIFEIENELENHKVLRIEWQPMTLWGKYWGIFIDLFFLTTISEDIGTTYYQEKSIKEATENPIKKNNA